ncbi:hypothetical protein BDP27DRAFT_1347492, partial [Rhodocollybia butyracea]
MSFDPQPTKAAFFAGASNFIIEGSSFQVTYPTENSRAEIKSTAPPGYTPGMTDFPAATLFFTGRKDILLEMDTYFGSQPMATERKIFLLLGIGGAGKTQCVLEFVRQSQTRFTKHYFISAHSEESIQASYYDIAIKNGLQQPDSWRVGLQLLAKDKEEWLVVMDNADDPRFNLGNFLPKANAGNIIITSRNRHLDALSPNLAEVNDMLPQDGVELLLKHAIKGRQSSAEERLIAYQIAARVHYFTLALVHAGSYICRHNCIGSYLQTFEKHLSSLLSKHFTQSSDNFNLSVYATWDISWQMLTEKSRTFLRICSCYHYERIPRILFQKAIEKMKIWGWPPLAAQAQLEVLCSPDFDWNEMEMNKMSEELMSYSLVTVEKDGFYSIHPLIHGWIKDSTDNSSRRILEEGAQSIVAITVEDADWTEIGYMRLLVSHCRSFNIGSNRHTNKAIAKLWSMCGHYGAALKLLEPLLEETKRTLGEKHPETLGLMQKLEEPVVELSKEVLGEEHPDTLTRIQNLAISYSEVGRFNDALQLAEPLVELSKKIMGEDHPDTLSRIQNLANRYSKVGRYNDAVQLEEPLVELSKKVLGEEHPDTLSRIQNLASRYSEVGRYIDALQLAEPLMELSKKVFGEEHPDTLSRIQNLASRYSEVGRYNDALQLEEPLVELSKKVLGKSTQTPLLDTELGNQLFWVGRYNDALQLEEPVVELSKKVLGEEHPDTLSRIQNLANRYSEVGRYNDALSKKVLGEEHPDTLSRIQNLAGRYSEVGRYNDALHLAEPLVELSKKVLGEEHPDTLSRIQNLANRYSEVGRYNDAVQLAEPLLELSKKYNDALQLAEPLVELSKKNLAISYSEVGRYNDALQLAEPLVELSKKAMGKEHPDTLGRIQNLATDILNRIQSLAINYSEVGRYNDALQLDRASVELSKKVFGEEHPDTLSRIQNLASRYSRIQNLASRYSEVGRYNDALQLAEPLVELSKKALGEDHPHTLSRIQNLAINYSEVERFNDALQLAEPLVELSKKVLGEEHPDTLGRIQNLVISYSEVGRYNDALQLAEPLVELSKKVLGEEHPDTLAGYRIWQTDILSPLWSSQRRFWEKNIPTPLAGYRTWQTDILSLFWSSQKKVLGEEHPDTLSRIQILASRYSRVGRYIDALQLAEPLMELSKKVLGEEHPDTLGRIQNLVISYSEVGRFNDALQLAEPLVELSKKNLANRYSEAGRYNDAVQLEAHLVELSKMVLGEDHPGTLGRIHNLAISYSE